MQSPFSEAIVQLEVGKLREPAFYEILFAPNSAAEQDFPPDRIIQVRPLDPAGRSYEIVTGVEQYRAARRQGARAVAAVVKELSEEESRRYATDEFLRTAAFTSARSVVQLLIAAKDNVARGGNWSVERLTQLLGVKKSTYTHAWSNVNFVCEELRRSDPGAAHLPLPELVAMAVRTNFLPEFTELYAGRMTVNRFYRQVYQASGVGRERSRQQREAKGRNKSRGDADLHLTVDGTAAADSAPAPAASFPQHLIAEAVVKLAQAASVGDGNDSDGGEQVLDRQIVTILDSHPNIEPAIRLICRKLLDHLDSGRSRHPRSKSTRSAQPSRLGDARQLSFDLPTTAGCASRHESERDHDEAHAA